MPNCKKLPGSRAARLHAKVNARTREHLAMSVIVEEPAHMRESRLKDQEKHPEDIKPNNDSFLEAIEECRQSIIRNSTGYALEAPESPVSMAEPAAHSRSASSSASTAPSSTDERYEQHSAGGSRSPPRSPPGAPRQHPNVDSRSSHHRPHPRDPRSVASHADRSSYRKQSDPEYTPRSKKPSSFSSSSEEDDVYDQHRRPPRRQADARSNTRPKASSIPPSKSSSRHERERVHRHQTSDRTATSPYSSSDNMPRSKSATKLDSIHQKMTTAKLHPVKTSQRPRVHARNANQRRRRQCYRRSDSRTLSETPERRRLQHLALLLPHTPRTGSAFAAECRLAKFRLLVQKKVVVQSRRTRLRPCRKPKCTKTVGYARSGT